MTEVGPPPESLPLQGLRVVSVAVNLPGPVATRRLVALGASVVKVEPPAGDPLRVASRAWYDELVAGQTVSVLDLKSDDGRQALDALLADADVLLTSSRTAALHRLGLDHASVSARFPRLCVVAIVGRPSPSDHAGHDLTYQAAAGTVRPPYLPTVPVADLAGAERVVADVLAVLLTRERTGVAAHRQVALADVASDLAAGVRHGLTVEGGALGGGLPAYGLYATRSGYVALVALEPHFWRRLCEELAVGGSREELEQAFTQRTAQEWQQWAAERDVPLVAVAEPQPH
jgi:crotonobetainyl-CoA:carnitine CoA-transferase CaiB-like acyl-CoA transferase